MSVKSAAAVALTLATALGGWWLAAPQGAQPVSAALAQDAAAIEIADMTMGQADAPVTLVEYASFTCPHCAAFHETVFKPLKAEYIDTGKVRFVAREVYFDKFGLWGAMVARCGGDMKYFGISAMLYETQKDWVGDGNPGAVADNLRKIGLKAGIAPEALDACLNNGAMAQAMVESFEKNAAADDITATPTLIVDGEKHSNMSYDELKAIIDAKLAD